MPDGTRCSIEGCERSTHARGWCGMHYQRWYKFGDVNAHVKEQVQVIRGPADERFWPKVDAFGDCWEWTAGKNKYGYGLFRFKNRSYLAHRFAYETLVGDIPEGEELDHLCRNRACCNPDHLQAVTRRVNVLRGFATSGLNARKTRCPQGHAYDEANTYISKTNGGRQCRACSREYMQGYHERKREAQRET